MAHTKVTTDKIIAYWMYACEKHAARRCGELSVPYEPLWEEHSRLRPASDEERHVLVLWAEMSGNERKHWATVYPDLEAIPEEFLQMERRRWDKIRADECAMRVRRVRE
jgi:hypothetical protein